MSDAPTAHSVPDDPMPEGCGKPLGFSGNVYIYCGSMSSCRECKPAVMAWRQRRLAQKEGSGS